MTKNALKNILLTGIVAALCGCSAEKKSESAVEIPGYDVSVLSFDTTGHFFADTNNPQFKFSYKLSVPNEGISSCADSIRMAIIAEATGVRTNDIEAAKKAKLTELAVLSEEEVVAYREMFGSDEIPCDLECEAGKVFENEDVYNTEFSSYSYMGGAHPYSYVNYQIWDKVMAKKLSYGDIFVDESESQLTGMILDSLCKMMKVSAHDHLVDAGILDVKDVSPNNSMRIYTDSLSFNYRPYEIAAYAVGPIEVRFSFSDLKPLMKEESPIYKLAE